MAICPPKHPLEVWLDEPGRSQSELARAVGTHQPHISAFLAGRDGFGNDLAKRIAEHTGIPLEQFLFNRPRLNDRKKRLEMEAKQAARQAAQESHRRAAGARHA